MPNEIAPAQMLRMASPYPERAPADTSGVVRISRFGIAFEAGSAWQPGDLQWPAGGKPATGCGGRAVSELGIETPDEDAAEQAREVPEENDEELSELPLEVTDGKAAGT